MKAKIISSLGEQQSQYNKHKYIVIKTLGEDGNSYDVTPSSDQVDYDGWKDIAENGIGKTYDGFMFLKYDKKTGRRHFNKDVLPIETR